MNLPECSNCDKSVGGKQLVNQKVIFIKVVSLNIFYLTSHSIFQVNVSSRMLRWNEVPEDFSGKFEIAISSDCLFFDEGRPQLVRV
jgi:hypothetical protein